MVAWPFRRRRAIPSELIFTLFPGVADQVVAVEQPVAANRHLYVADN